MQKLIYIVDDETTVLETLGFCLRRTNPDWIIREFTLPAGALEAVRHRPPHVVLTDQTMPGMIGSQMLDQIRQVSPQTVRIIISAFAARTEKLGSAHQCLSKPFDFRDLQNRVRQALHAQESLQNPDLARLVASLQSFPALPLAYTELLNELERENSSFDRIAKLLQNDGGILTRVIQMANSPLFGREAVITQPAEALLQLGTGVVKALVLSMHVFAGYDKCRFPEISVESWWHHGWEAGHLAQQLCRQKLNEAAANDVFFAALVYDLGRLILMENQPERFRQACRKALDERLPLAQVEKGTFGVRSTDLSAFMLRLWGLPQPVIDAVSFCHAPWENVKAKGFTTATALYLADHLVRQRQPPDDFVLPELNQAYLESVDAYPPTDTHEPMTL